MSYYDDWKAEGRGSPYYDENYCPECDSRITGNTCDECGYFLGEESDPYDEYIDEEYTY